MDQPVEQPTGFLDLPQELRDNIYGFIFADRPSALDFANDSENLEPTALLQCCSSVRHKVNREVFKSLKSPAAELDKILDDIYAKWEKTIAERQAIIGSIHRSRPLTAKAKVEHNARIRRYTYKRSEEMEEPGKALAKIGWLVERCASRDSSSDLGMEAKELSAKITRRVAWVAEKDTLKAIRGRRHGPGICGCHRRSS